MLITHHPYAEAAENVRGFSGIGTGLEVELLFVFELGSNHGNDAPRRL